MHPHWAVVTVAAACRVLLMLLWWSPPLFLDRWLRLTGQTRHTLPRTMLAGTLFACAGSLLMALVVGAVLRGLGIRGAGPGLFAGGMAWLGLVMPPMLSSVIYEGKPFELFAINSGFQLAALLAMGAVLAQAAP